MKIRFHAARRSSILFFFFFLICSKTEMEKMTAVIELAHEMMELETRSDIAEHGSGKSEIPRK